MPYECGIRISGSKDIDFTRCNLTVEGDFKHGIEVHDSVDVKFGVVNVLVGQTNSPSSSFPEPRYYPLTVEVFPNGRILINGNKACPCGANLKFRYCHGASK